jgi:hypothetical protein
MKIIHTLGEVRRGRMLEDLDAELRHVVDAVRDAAEAGRIVSGTLTLKLTIKSSADDAVTLEVTDQVTSTMPRRAPGRSIFFAGAGGVLLRSDPRQSEMKLEAAS